MGARRQIEKHALALLDHIANSSGRTVDTLYATLVHKLGITQPFFKAGWGDLQVVDFQSDAELLYNWPPDHFDIKIDLKKLSEGVKDGIPYELMEGTFRSPCQGRVYDALPIESRTTHIQLLAPKNKMAGQSCVLHLAGTGDHGFDRRIRMGSPLLKKGISTLVLESPYYGRRRPANQEGSRLLRVSDLLVLGRSTIEESLCLLEWVTKLGFSKLGMCGFSMGGVHASMVASLYPKPIACTPLLAPRSASVSFCDGALKDATAWEPLVKTEDENRHDVMKTIRMAAQPTGVTQAAKYVRMGDVHNSTSSKASTSRERFESSPAGPPEREESVKLAAQELRSTSEKSLSNSTQVVKDGNDSQRMSGSSNATTSYGSAAAFLGYRLPGWVRGGGSALYGGLGLVNRQLGRLWGEKQSLDYETARHRLEQVLETYTDVTRFPCPKAPDAAVIVGALEDAYVTQESIRQMAAHWPGSEVRWVPGGHVSAFLLQQPAFRQAISDSLDRLQPPP